MQDKDDGSKEHWFVYQERKFLYHKEDKRFHKLDFPVHEPFKYYMNSKGHSAESLASAKDKWGINRLGLLSAFSIQKQNLSIPFHFTDSRFRCQNSWTSI